MKQKYVIGLGCSWTQGEGGYPQEVVEAHNGKTQWRSGDPRFSDHPDSDYYLRVHELENSWVNQLCKYHFPEYKSLNLGIKGIGNQAAVGQLNFVDQHDLSNAEGIAILMLSGFERFDIFQQRPMDHTGFNKPDGYSNGEYRHEKWRTAWPIEQKTGDGAFWTCYARELWSEQFVATFNMTALLNLQTWAKAHNFKVVVANAFNIRPEGIYNYFKEHTGSLADKFDWSCYLHNEPSGFKVPEFDYVAFMQKLVQLDGNQIDDWRHYYGYYRTLDWPSEYLTNDDGAHPTIKGYRVIADELARFIKTRGYIEES